MRVSINHILAAAEEICRIPPRDILGRYRYQYLVRVRHAVYYLAWQQGISYCAIGRRMNRDHSSIMHGKRKCEHTMTRDQGYSSLVQAIGQLAYDRAENEREAFRRIAPQIEQMAA